MMMMSHKNVDRDDEDGDDVLDSRWGLAPPLPSPGDISFLRLPTCMSPLFNSGMPAMMMKLVMGTLMVIVQMSPC